MLTTTNKAQQTEADVAELDIMEDSTLPESSMTDTDFTPHVGLPEVDKDTLDNQIQIEEVGQTPVVYDNGVAAPDIGGIEDAIAGGTDKAGKEAAALAWAAANPYTPQARAILAKSQQYNYAGAHGTLEAGYKYDGSYDDAMNLIHTNSDQFHNGDRNSEEFKNSTDVLSSRSFVDTYLADIGSEGDTNTTDFFNVVHNMYVHNPEGFKQWASDTPEMAIRFHAMAATDSFAAQDEGSFDHQRQADMIGQGLRVGAGWGDEQKRDGQVWATNYGGEVSKDVNNPESGGDFWKIGTPQKVTDGIGNYIKDNPVESIAIVGAIAFAGPLASWASAAAGGGVAGAAAGGAAAGALTGGVSSFAAGGDFGDVLEGALLGGVAGAVTGGISEYISPAQMGPAFEGIPDFNDPSFGIEDATKLAKAADMPMSWIDSIASSAEAAYDNFSWGDAMATVVDSVTDMSALVPDGAISSAQDGAGALGLGAASALVGNGTGARGEGGLFDYTKLSPAAYAVLGPMIDNTEGLTS